MCVGGGRVKIGTRENSGRVTELCTGWMRLGSVGGRVIRYRVTLSGVDVPCAQPIGVFNGLMSVTTAAAPCAATFRL